VEPAADDVRFRRPAAALLEGAPLRFRERAAVELARRLELELHLVVLAPLSFALAAETRARAPQRRVGPARLIRKRCTRHVDVTRLDPALDRVCAAIVVDRLAAILRLALAHFAKRAVALVLSDIVAGLAVRNLLRRALLAVTRQIVRTERN